MCSSKRWICGFACGGGYFVSSTSHLDPFHLHSFWKFTPYGYMTLLKKTGFSEILIKPSIDGFTLLARSLLKYPMTRIFNTFFNTESPPIWL